MCQNRFSKLNIKIEFSAILFYSMFLCEKLHQNLIICGKYSEQIAHMYSYIVHGAKAAVLDCSNSYEPTVQSNIESLKAKVIVVKYPLNQIGLINCHQYQILQINSLSWFILLLKI